MADDRRSVLLPALVLLAVATVPLLGGRLSALADVSLRRGELALAALALQVLVVVVVPDRLDGVHVPLHLASYVLAGAAAWANRAVPGVALLALGGALNAAAIVANGGVMPASPEALATAGLADVPSGEFVNSAAVEDARLAPLGDVFAIPAGVPLANVFSIGDVLIVAGLTWGVHRICATRVARVRGPRARLSGAPRRAG